jgi:hypothetical protein
LHGWLQSLNRTAASFTKTHSFIQRGTAIFAISDVFHKNFTLSCQDTNLAGCGRNGGKTGPPSRSVGGNKGSAFSEPAAARTAGCRNYGKS